MASCFLLISLYLMGKQTGLSFTILHTSFQYFKKLGVRALSYHRNQVSTVSFVYMVLELPCKHSSINEYL